VKGVPNMKKAIGILIVTLTMIAAVNVVSAKHQENASSVNETTVITPNDADPGH
jgi:hypothetical protein